MVQISNKGIPALPYQAEDHQNFQIACYKNPYNQNPFKHLLLTRKIAITQKETRKDRTHTLRYQQGLKE